MEDGGEEVGIRNSFRHLPKEDRGSEEDSVDSQTQVNLRGLEIHETLNVFFETFCRRPRSLNFPIV